MLRRVQERKERGAKEVRESLVGKQLSRSVRKGLRQVCTQRGSWTAPEKAEINKWGMHTKSRMKFPGSQWDGGNRAFLLKGGKLATSRGIWEKTIGPPTRGYHDIARRSLEGSISKSTETKKRSALEPSPEGGVEKRKGNIADFAIFCLGRRVHSSVRGRGYGIREGARDTERKLGEWTGCTASACR